MPPSSMNSIDSNCRAKISASPLEAFWNMSAIVEAMPPRAPPITRNPVLQAS